MSAWNPDGAGAASAAGVTPRLALRVASCAVLALATIFVYRESFDHDFVTMDDYPYVVENQEIHDGLNGRTFAWAMGTALEPTGWAPFPLTWLSLALDVELSGLDPRGFHRTNVLLHVANALLLYLALAALTGSRWRAYLTACVFSLHPLHVESVAWVSERKDVLSGLFFMLTLWLWAQYGKRGSVWRYSLVFSSMALGLLSKSSLVTLPFLLLLLDFWPLARIRTSPGESGAALSGLRRVVLEKLPLFALSIAAGYATYAAGASVDAILGTQSLAPARRLSNAAVSYVGYLRDSIWPVDLAAFYPYSESAVSVVWVFGAVTFLVAVSLAAVLKLKTHPHLAVGWFWFLGMLIPMIGLVQAGPQARADRFMYLPQIGLCIALLWSIPNRIMAHRSTRWVVGVAAAIVLLAFGFTTQRQLRVWQNGITLFEHTRRVAGNSAFVSHGLGQAYLRADRYEEAAAEFRSALSLAPRWSSPMTALGTVMSESGQHEKAVRWYERALKRDPRALGVRVSLAQSLLQLDAVNRAIPHLEQVLAAHEVPGSVDAHAMLGHAYARTGRAGAARTQYEAALRLRPDQAEVHANLGLLLAQADEKALRDSALSHLERAVQLGLEDADVSFVSSKLLFAQDREEAGIGALREAHRLKPDWLVPINNLAWYLVSASEIQLREPRESLRLARRAAAMSGRENPDVLETLSVALVANQQFDRAASVLAEASLVARRQADAVGAERLEEQRKALLDRAR